MIPERISAWNTWAHKLGVDALSLAADFRAVAASLPESTIIALSEFCEMEARNGGLNALRQWLAPFANSEVDDPDEEEVRNLFRLFRYLGIQGVVLFKNPMFSSHSLPEARLKWSKVPPLLQFLIDPALEMDRFKYSFSEEGRDFIKASVTGEQLARFRDVANQVRHIGYKLVRDFYSNFGAAEHREASIFFNAIAVLDALGLPYYDGAPE